MSLLALTQRLGALDLPHTPLGAWPTPIERLEHLGAQRGAAVWVKRDDLSAPRYGGNKVRKLELLLGAALRAGCRSVLTVGGVGSNHVVATATHAAALGLATQAVVFPQPETEHVRANAARAQALGVTLFPCGSRLAVPLAWRRTRRLCPEAYAIGPGGSSPLGTVGYVAAACELAEQIAAGELPAPDEIVVALGSGGTAAGLLLGCAVAGLRTTIVAVRVVEWPLVSGPAVRWLAHRTARLLERAGAKLPRPRCAPRLELVGDQLGRGYGHVTAAGAHAVSIAREEAGLHLETTYTGKAFAALLARVDGVARDRRVLFWNTYGGSSTPSRVLCE
jgi:D-cysteine desulfhydrase